MTTSKEGSATSYLKIIKSCRRLKELTLALLACKKGIERFPGTPDLLIAKGELHLLQFNQNKNVDELKTALQTFTLTLTINPHHYLAKTYSVKIYLKFGLLEKAKKIITSILQTSPDDPTALSLLNEIELKQGKKQLQEQKEEPLKTGQPPEKVAIEEDSRINYKLITEHLSHFKGFKQIQSLLVIDQYGSIIKKFNRSPVNDNLLSAVTANIYRSSRAGTEKIKFGSFKTGVITTPMGNFFLTDLQGAILLLLVNEETNQKKVEMAIQGYLNIIYPKNLLQKYKS